MPHAGEIAALGTAACWVATALAFEAAGRRIGSLTVNILRLGMAIGLLALWGWAFRGLAWPSDASPYAWRWLTLSGLVGFTFGDLCLFRAFVVLGSRLSVLIMSLAPPLAALLGWLVLGEVLAPLDLFGMGLTAAGVAWAVGERQRRPVGGPALPADPALPAGPAPPLEPRRRRLAGVLLGLGGALGQAGGLVLSKLGMGDYDPFAATQIRVIAGFAGYVVLFTLLARWRRVVTALGAGRALGFTAVGAFFGPFLGVSLSLFAVQRIDAGVAASLMATSPVLILPVVVLAGRERLGPGAVLGALLAFAGVVLLLQ